MRRLIDVASLDRIFMDVSKLLPQGRFRLDDLGMASLLPQLRFAGCLVARLVVFEPIEQRADLSLTEMVEDSPRGVGLEVADLLCKVGSCWIPG